MIKVDPADGRPMYQQIIDEMRRLIALGILKSEDALPSVRHLASELRLNPNTVAQAYRELERDGVVHVRRGQGTYVSQLTVPPSTRQAFSTAVARRALLDAHRHNLTAADLIEAIELLSASNTLEKATS